mmetsp:Transcript_1908/g.2556  ORF Transcript_1908/g.2556 Transcript_1908/m.2556 type:complete len:931 (+) Transcript_1908:98-2890(+)
MKKSGDHKNVKMFGVKFHLQLNDLALQFTAILSCLMILFPPEYVTILPMCQADKLPEEQKYFQEQCNPIHQSESGSIYELISSVDALEDKKLLKFDPPATKLTSEKYLMITSISNSIEQHRKALLGACLAATNTKRVLVEPCYCGAYICQCSAKTLTDKVISKKTWKQFPLSFFWDISRIDPFCTMIPYTHFQPLLERKEVHVHLKKSNGTVKAIDGIKVDSWDELSRPLSVCSVNDSSCHSAPVVLLDHFDESYIPESFPETLLSKIFFPNSKTILKYAEIFWNKYLMSNYIALEWMIQQDSYPFWRPEYKGLSSLGSLCSNILDTVMEQEASVKNRSVLFISTDESGLGFIGGKRQKRSSTTVTEVHYDRWIKDQGILFLINFQLAVWSDVFVTCDDFCIACRTIDPCSFPKAEPFYNFKVMLSQRKTDCAKSRNNEEWETVPQENSLSYKEFTLSHIPEVHRKSTRANIRLLLTRFRSWSCGKRNLDPTLCTPPEQQFGGESTHSILARLDSIEDKNLLQSSTKPTEDDKYLMLTGCVEGIGQHRKIVLKACQAAKAENRVLVEPCYCGGRICTCSSSQTLSNVLDYEYNSGLMFPLSFYWDFRKITEHCNMIPFSQFEMIIKTRNDSYVHFMKTHGSEVPQGSIAGMNINSWEELPKRSSLPICKSNLCNSAMVVILGKMDRELWQINNIKEHQLSLVFLPNPMTVGQYATMFRHKFLTKEFFAFQWRSEHQSLLQLRNACANVLSEIIKTVGVQRNQSVLLVSDVVYPNSSVGASLSPTARNKFSRMSDAGVILKKSKAVKVDFLGHWIHDSGILALIDFQLAVWSEMLFPCASGGDFCRACSTIFCKSHEGDDLFFSFAGMLMQRKADCTEILSGASQVSSKMRDSWDSVLLTHPTLFQNNEQQIKSQVHLIEEQANAIAMCSD